MKDNRHASGFKKFSREQFYRLCHEFSTDIIYLLDRDMIIQNVSPSVMRVLGYTPEECIGSSFAIINKISQDDAAFLMLDFQSIMSGLIIDNREYVCLTHSGKELVFEVNGHAAYKNGTVQGAIISARDITHQKHYENELKITLGSLRKSLDVTIKTISRAIDWKDPYTAGHQQRVSDLARTIAGEMNLNFEVINGIRMASIVHDIGKLYIPSEILSKPGRLHPAEFELIKIHPIIGFDILSSIDFPWPVAAAVLQHHERSDGSGYPYGICGKYMQLEAKIIAVADVVEAFMSHRPYRALIGIDEALDEITKNSDKLYDPEVVDACLSLFCDKGYTFSAEKKNLTM